MSAYYNEIDPFAAAWLRELIKAKLIADGEVDTRSIVDVQPGDLAGFAQCHFFAGIGGWSRALRLAGWPDDRHVWTGSCPCQPFSAAGKGGGKNDARHLWPQFRRLVRKRRPSIVFGEQVASKAGRIWLSAVFADAEALAYRAAGADLCAAGVGAPHIRQRLYFVLADSGSQRFYERAQCNGASIGVQSTEASRWNHVGRCGELGYAYDSRSQRRIERRDGADQRAIRPASGASELGNSEIGVATHERISDECSCGVLRASQQLGSIAGATSGTSGGDSTERGQEFSSGGAGSARLGFWSDCDWIECRDGKARPVESGSFPLAYGIPARVGRLRGYGNAIVPQVAAIFIEAYIESVAA